MQRTLASRRRAAAAGGSADGAAAAASSGAVPTTAAAAADSAAPPNCLRFSVDNNNESEEGVLLLASAAAAAGGRRHSPSMRLAAWLLQTALSSARDGVPVGRCAEARKQGRLAREGLSAQARCPAEQDIRIGSDMRCGCAISTPKLCMRPKACPPRCADALLCAACFDSRATGCG